MTSPNELRQDTSPRDLLNELYQVYGKRRIQRDPFGRRSALPSEVARVVTQSKNLRQRVVGAPAED